MPTRGTDLALAATGEEQKPKQRSEGITLRFARTPECAQFVIVKHTLAGLPLSNQNFRPDSVAWRMLQSVVFSYDRPIKEGSHMAKEVVGLISGTPIGCLLKDPCYIAALDRGDWSAPPRFAEEGL